MTHRKVSAGNGVNWLTESTELLRRNPAPFLLMGLVVAVIGAVPVLGGLVLLVFGPALMGGIVYAAHQQANLRPVEVADLVRAFQQGGKLGPMVMLCLPGLVAMVVITALVVIFLGSALLGVGISAATGSETAAAVGLGGSALAMLVLSLTIALLSWSLVLFAIPRVMLLDAEPFAAMADSFRACKANLGAFLLFALLEALLAIVVGGILGTIVPLFGQVIATMLLVPLSAVASYRAWRDVFGETQALEGPLPPVESTEV